MKNMRIGVELNGVLRDTIGRIEEVYTRVFLEKGEDEVILPQYTTDDKDEFTSKLPDEGDFKYEFTGPVTSLNLTEFFKFRDDDEYYSFLYEDHPMHIFGNANSIELTSFADLNSLYKSLRDENDILIVSDEIGRSKPASLFFLSKFGCLIETIKFYSNTTINTMWDSVDILVTANPDLLKNHPPNKIVIKFKQEYNKHIPATYEIDKIKDLDGIITLIKK